jgi:uncharacterized membrane protein YdbT with pleckstrin-like domain
MGQYVNASLAPNEEIVYEARYHPVIFWFPVAIFTLWLQPLIARWPSEFVITTRRVVIKTGLVSRRTVEINLHHVESVNVDQSILGRLLDFGTVTIVGSGGTHEVFAYIEKPLAFRRAYQHQP